MDNNKTIWPTIGELFHTSSGGTPKTNVPSFWHKGDLPWINSGKLKDAKIVEPSDYITESGLDNSSTKLFPEKSVVIALTGSTLAKLGILTFNCAISQNVVGIYPSAYYLPEFIFHYLKHKRNFLIGQATGSAQPHINKQVIDRCEIPLISISEQNKIVDEIGDIELSISEIENKITQIENLRMKAFESFIYKNGDFYSSVPLSQFCTQRSDRIGEEWRNKLLIGVSNTEGITELRITNKSTFENYKVVYPGDFIYNPMRINIGSIAVFNGSEIALTSPDYVVFTANNQISHEFLLFFLKSEYGLTAINSRTKGSVRSRLYFAQLQEIEIPYSGSKSHEKAESIFKKFSELLKGGKVIYNNAFNSLSEVYAKRFDILKPTGRIENLKKSVIIEKQEIVMDLQIKNKKRVMAKSKNKESIDIPILEVIRKNFEDRQFTFTELLKIVPIPYEDLKEEIYKLVDKGIEISFDKEKGSMYFKSQNQ